MTIGYQKNKIAFGHLPSNSLAVLSASDVLPALRCFSLVDVGNTVLPGLVRSRGQALQSPLCRKTYPPTQPLE